MERQTHICMSFLSLSASLYHECHLIFSSQTKMLLSSLFHLPPSPKGAIIMSGEGSHTRILNSPIDHSLSGLKMSNR